MKPLKKISKKKWKRVRPAYESGAPRYKVEYAQDGAIIHIRFTPKQ